MPNTQNPIDEMIAIIMGSRSDLEVMKEAAEVLEDFGCLFELTIVSAHRTPERMMAYAREAEHRGVEAIIAGAGGAAHLPGMVASMTTLPVIGVPIKSNNSLDGLDSLLSIVQMPKGVPVATVAINGAANAALLALRIVAVKSPALRVKLKQYREKMLDDVMIQVQQTEKEYGPRSS